MDSAALHSSAQQMIEDLKQRMDYFEAELRSNTNPSPTITTLAAEYASFKNFTLTALRALQEQVELAAQSIDQLEMRGRRKILLIHGVPEEQREDTASVTSKVVIDKLHISPFSITDISRCHRMGRLSTNRPRPILVKLCDVTLRDKVWFAKTQLKNSGVTLSEFLTKARHEVFMKARQQFGISNCWTREGNVYVVGPDGSRHRVNWLGDLHKLVGQLQLEPVVVAASSRPPVASLKPANSNDLGTVAPVTRRAAAIASKK
ncbi:Uncharacterized protein OBRU01_26871 [Operophtera brumata]|uniref:Uncharacterized protein n=1 Tax=Operophtera brumata TaxID=104452 RepID=A0A0L7K245_OPEBR|nr:Uncharacterized protein OBRU01_26871 [Operophtera brumata]